MSAPIGAASGVVVVRHGGQLGLYSPARPVRRLYAISHQMARMV